MGQQQSTNFPPPATDCVRRFLLTPDVANIRLTSKAFNQLTHQKRPGIKRIWVDGCFDMMHFGHGNFIRQARTLDEVIGLGEAELYVGSHTDEEIVRVKGCAPVMKQAERYASLRACKWVTAVIEDVPYSVGLDTLDANQVDYVIHGDDVCVEPDGFDVYGAVKARGMFRTVPRTKGISTTDLVDRMLKTGTEAELWQHANSYITNRKLAQFYAGNRGPTKDDKVVYVAGDFDLFHHGHAAFLREAKKLGTYLLVGVWGDKYGPRHAVMTMQERVLSVLSCKYTDDCISPAPRKLTEDLIKQFDVQVVVWQGDSGGPGGPAPEGAFQVAKEKGIYHEVKSGVNLTGDDIIQRVKENQLEYEKRNAAKIAKDPNAVR